MFVRRSTLHAALEQSAEMAIVNTELRALSREQSVALREALGQIKALTAQLLALHVPREVDVSEPLPTLYQTDQKLVQQARANERPSPR